jgi:hypothetical protein
MFENLKFGYRQLNANRFTNPAANPFSGNEWRRFSSQLSLGAIHYGRPQYS